MNNYFWWTSSSGRVEFKLPRDVVASCFHSGQCNDDVIAAIERPDIAATMAEIDPIELIQELREYGAWTNEELSNHRENLERILWLAAGDIQESSEYMDGIN